MANARNGNSHYVDATGVLETSNCKVAAVTIWASAANAILILTDNAASPVNKVKLGLATAGDTQHYNFTDSPITFPAGLKVGTLTNAIVTIIYA